MHKAGLEQLGNAICAAQGIQSPIYRWIPTWDEWYKKYPEQQGYESSGGMYYWEDCTLEAVVRVPLIVFLHELGHHVHVVRHGYKPDLVLAAVGLDPSEDWAAEFAESTLSILAEG